jgi:hypothetical protein
MIQSIGNKMPTLMNVPHDSVLSRIPPNGNNDEQLLIPGNNRNDDYEGSTTILDESTILEDNSPKGTGSFRDVECVSRKDKSVTFDDSFVLRSTGKSKPPEISKRREERTLDSNVSLTMSYDEYHGTQHEKDHYLRKSPARLTWHTQVIDRPRPNHDEYKGKHEDFVNSTISNFKLKFPGKLREYRDLSADEKVQEQKRVMEFLNRLGISNNKNCESQPFGSLKMRRRQHAQSNLQSPTCNARDRLLDDTLSPAFSPTPTQRNKEDDRHGYNDDSPMYNHSFEAQENCCNNFGEKSELLLSMEDNDEPVGAGNTNSSRPSSQDESVEFPANNEYDDDSSSSSSVELVRQAPEETNLSDDEASYDTPEDQKVQPPSLKRMATTSGKRGADLQRVRPNDYPAGSIHLEDGDDGMNLTRRLERLSISPSPSSSPPKNIFAASQSPISPRLTYHTPLDENEDSDYCSGEDVRISMGRDSAAVGRQSDRSHDTMATNTPPRNYRDKEKSRAFREVPVNVSLKDGAIFHLAKLTVKHAEKKNVSKSARAKKAPSTALQRRRHVDFPDPLVRYGSRQGRALKEIYSWVRRAEIDFEEGACSVPAIGIFFSLSEQQIIDVSMKLLLKDSSENIQSNSQIKANSLKGKTLVVARSKEDTAAWESVLRENTGCSVLNHSTLPLSERIRVSSAERACAHDVVLTTFDAVKSPDIAVPLTEDGRAIVTKAGNDRSWHSSRSASQHDSSPQLTKQLSILHRIHFRRLIFVDVLGRKSYLAKGGTARATAAVALSGDTRVVFFRESEADGSYPFKALRKSDKRAIHSVSSVLHLNLNQGVPGNNVEEDSDSESVDETPLESIAMDFKDMC